MLPPALNRHPIAALGGLLIVLLSGGLAHVLVFSQLGGYDLSILVDLQWRLHSGQVPGIDFPSTVPPLLLMLVKAVSHGSPTWASLTTTYAAFTLFCYLFLVLAARPEKSSPGWWSAAAVIISLPLIYTNHVWHSNISQLCAVLLFYSLANLFASASPTRRDWILLAISSGLVCLTKQNVGAPAVILSGALVLLIGRELRWKATACIAAGAVLGILWAYLYTGLPPAAFIYSYTAVVGRANPDPQMWVDIPRVATFPYIVAALGIAATLVLISLVMNAYGNWRLTLLMQLFAVLSVIPLLTDWDTKINNLPLPLFVAAYHLLQRDDAVSRTKWARFARAPALGLVPLLLATAALAVKGGMIRERMMHVGPLAFYEEPADRVVPAGYFGGLRTGPRLIAVLDELETVKRSHPAATKFFGPRIEFAYAVTGAQSPRHLPIWWHPGTSYAPRDEEKISRIFARARIGVLVFLKGDRTRIPPDILREIERMYEPVPGYEALDVYVRRGDRAA